MHVQHFFFFIFLLFFKFLQNTLQYTNTTTLHQYMYILLTLTEIHVHTIYEHKLTKTNQHGTGNKTKKNHTCSNRVEEKTKNR